MSLCIDVATLSFDGSGGIIQDASKKLRSQLCREPRASAELKAGGATQQALTEELAAQLKAQKNASARPTKGRTTRKKLERKQLLTQPRRVQRATAQLAADCRGVDC